MDYEEKAWEVLNAFEEELSFAHTVVKRAAVREKHRDRLAKAIREAVEEERKRIYSPPF